MQPIEAGALYWNGTQVTDPARFFIPPRCAYTAQLPKLFSTTLKDNILLGLPEGKIDISQAIQNAVMEQDIEKFDNGIETLIGVKGVKLSGGQIQRTAAARMFIREPELLIF